MNTEYLEEIKKLTESSKQIRIEFDLLISLVNAYKPNDKSELDKNFAIFLTELKKSYAFFKTYIEVEK